MDNIIDARYITHTATHKTCFLIAFLCDDIFKIWIKSQKIAANLTSVGVASQCQELKPNSKPRCTCTTLIDFAKTFISFHFFGKITNFPQNLFNSSLFFNRGAFGAATNLW